MHYKHTAIPLPALAAVGFYFSLSYLGKQEKHTFSIALYSWALLLAVITLWSRLGRKSYLKLTDWKPNEPFRVKMR
jgi:hypothetical protein